MTDEEEFKFGIWWRPNRVGGLRDASPTECAAEIRRLRSERDELLDALRHVVRTWDDPGPMGTMYQMPRAISAARAAIAKATTP
jgi:hypothetical protein